jgi:hypothetical protein
VSAPVADAVLAQQHRGDLQTVTSEALRELAQLWAQLTDDDPETFRNALAAEMPSLVDFYGSAAATLGADWYEEVRDAERVPGRFRAVPGGLPDQGRLDSLIGWGTDPIFRPIVGHEEAGGLLVPIYGAPVVDEETLAQSLARIDGGLQRIVANADRDSILGSVTSDPQAVAWRRETAGSACTFCTMLASRGAVYKSERSAGFAAHDHCHCVAVPEFVARRRSGRSA